MEEEKCFLTLLSIQIHLWFLLDILTLRLDFVTQNQVGGQSEDKKKDAQHHEVNIKLCILHIQQLQDLLWFLKFTHSVWTL